MAENYNIEIQVEPGGSNDVGLSVQANPTATLTMATEVGGEVHEKNAEAWAVGKRGGVDVASTDVTYHNNAKYFAEQAVMIAGLTVTCSTLPAGSSATAVVTDVDGHKNIAFGIPEGEDGTNGYMHIKWAAHQPTADSDMSDVPNDYIGVYTGSSSTAPTTYTSYTWFKVKGEDGAAGPGVASGGTSGQFLMKTSSTDYATSWVTPDSTPGTNPNNVIKSSAVKAVKDTADFTKGLVAEEYDSVAHGGYAVGDYCYKTSSGTTKLMRCTGAVAQGGSWDPTKWTEVSLGEDVTDLRGDLDGLIDDTAGDGDTDKAWSADKLHDEFTSVNQAIEQLEFKGGSFDYAGIQSFTAGHEGIANWLKADVDAFQAGSGDPSPSNVRSIAGFSQTNILVAKVNLFDESAATKDKYINQNGVITNSQSGNTHGGEYSALIPVEYGKSYILYYKKHFGATWNARIHGYDSSGTWVRQILNTESTDDIPYSVKFSIAYTGISYIRISVNYERFTDIYLAEGSAYPITFPTSAGTVYGGELTVNADGTGKLVVDRASCTLTGNETYEYSSSTKSYFTTGTEAPGIKRKAYTEAFVGLSNKFKAFDASVEWASITAGNWVGYVSNSYDRLRFSFAGQQVNDISTLMAGTQVVYELATAIEYTLSAPQIATLLGLNNLWCDTGDCSFQYSESVDQGDTTTAVTTGEKAIWNNALNRLTDILDMLAFREAGFTATETHQQDTVIVVGTELYRTTAAIPAGNAIVPGTNCTKTTIIDEIVRLTTD